MLSHVLKSRAAQKLGAVLLGAYLSFALRTTRFVVEGADHLAPFAAQKGVVAAFWHESLPLMPALWLRLRARNPARRAKVLISHHRDGQLIAAVMRGMFVDVVHGSSARDRSGKPGKGGAAALRALLAALAQGDAVVITPDGPRGPARVAAPGTAQLAALSGAPILPCAGSLRHCVRLNSWDRMIVPLPFGRGALVCLPPFIVARDDAQGAHIRITAALTEAADRAATLCV